FSVLERAPLDGFDAGPALAAQAQLLIGRGDLAGADKILSAAWVRYVSAMQATGGRIDSRVLTSLDRVRDMPFQKRYVMVDAASARLYMIEDGRVVDQMKVIVGKSSAPTPMLASTID